MKTELVALILLAATASSAASQSTPACSDSQTVDCRENFIRKNLNLHQPDPSDPRDAAMLQDIRNSIGFAKTRLADEEAEAIKHLKDADGFIYSPTSPSTWIRRYNHEKERNQAAYDAALKQIAAVDNEKYAAYNHIIAETIQLYHLVPDVTLPAGNPGASRDYPIKGWAPHYSENAVYDKLGHGRLRTPTEIMALRRKYHLVVDDQHMDDPITGGTARDDSRISIFPTAFTDPDQLAEAIYHETTHWLDHVALGRESTRLENNQSEVIAYQSVINVGTAFGLDKLQIDQLRVTQEGYQRQASAIINHSLKDDSDWEPSTALDIPQGAVPENETGFDDIHAVVDEAVGRTREKARQQASDEGLRSALRDIVLKVCANPGSVRQAELDALPSPANPNFFLGKLPDGATGNCTRSLYMSLGAKLAHGSRLKLSDIQSLMPSGGEPAHDVPPPPPSPIPASDRSQINLPAIDAAAYRREWTAYYEAQLRNMRSLAQWDCANNGVLSNDNAQTYRTAYYSLLKNKNLEAGYRIEGYEPNTALNGITGCASELMVEFLKYPDNDLNNNARSVLKEYYPDPVPAPVVHQPTPPPRPRPVPQPNPCYIEEGIRWCPAKPR